MKISEVIWLGIILSVALMVGQMVAAHAVEIRHSSRLSPSDYLLQSREAQKDPVFDNYKVIDLSASIGIGADCGKIDITSTLQSTLANLFDKEKYFKEAGTAIIGGLPLLTACYFSPTWCAILKHTQINAQWLSKLRLDQCSLMDKYVDSRVEDYYQERQGCVRQSIARNGGNMESAMQSCNGNGLFRADLSNWAGSAFGNKVTTNRLIDSSAKWAGMKNPESSTSLNLLKSLVGDTVVSQGNVSVEYGPGKRPITPRTYLQSLESVTYTKLCNGILKKVQRAGTGTSIDKLISNDELKEISPNTDQLLVDRQTIRSLSYMSPKQQAIACQKLADSVAMTVFSTDMNRSLDILTTLSQNPNLPPNRKLEIEQKRAALKDSLETLVSLRKERNEPLNNVLVQINETGAELQSASVRDSLSEDQVSENEKSNRSELMNCTDGFLCDQ